MTAAPARIGVSAGAVLTNRRREVLLVKPTYKAGWNLPGGHLDEGESPREACMREIEEELGLRLKVSQEPLVTAWVADADEPPRLNFVFGGGRLTGQQQRTIRLPAGELSAWRFFPLNTDDPALVPSRIQALLAALRAIRSTGRPVYREVVLPR